MKDHDDDAEGERLADIYFEARTKAEEAITPAEKETGITEKATDMSDKSEWQACQAELTDLRRMLSEANTKRLANQEDADTVRRCAQATRRVILKAVTGSTDDVPATTIELAEALATGFAKKRARAAELEAQIGLARHAIKAWQDENTELEAKLDLYGDHEQKYEAWLVERDVEAKELEALRRVARALLQLRRVSEFDALEMALAAIPAEPTTEEKSTEKPPLAPVPRGHCNRCDVCGDYFVRDPVGLGRGAERHVSCESHPSRRTHCPGCGAPYEDAAVVAQEAAAAEEQHELRATLKAAYEAERAPLVVSPADDDPCPVSEDTLARWATEPGTNACVAWLRRETTRLAAKLADDPTRTTAVCATDEAPREARALLDGRTER